MKPFYVDIQKPEGQSLRDEAISHVRASGKQNTLSPALIAIYDTLTTPPRVEQISSSTPGNLIESLATRTYTLSHEQGGQIPYTVIREVVENFIHAGFDEVVVSILKSGQIIRFADQGPGIQDKDRVFLPGFTTATTTMKGIIKGVGSGLPVAQECLTFSGGTITIDDNLGKGTVVTLEMLSSDDSQSQTPEVINRTSEDSRDTPYEPPPLTTRQKQVLSLALEFGTIGPTLLSRELQVGLSTAYRDLEYLTQKGLITADESGKRSLTQEGSLCLNVLFAQ